jgi:hypothetical protein
VFALEFETGPTPEWNAMLHAIGSMLVRSP